MCKFPLTGCLQEICNFFRKTCAIRFLMSKAFQKDKFYQNLTSGSWSKQRFSLLQEKAVIQSVCLRTLGLRTEVLGLKEGLWVCRKSQKIATASDQYFLSYVIGLPPPAGIGLKKKSIFVRRLLIKSFSIGLLYNNLLNKMYKN